MGNPQVPNPELAGHNLATPSPKPRPSLWEIAALFAFIGMTSFGGGLTAYIRRLVVSQKKWLTDVVGVTIFRTKEIDEPIAGLGLQTAYVEFIFYVPNEEHETMIKLTYPPGTFRDHMA